MVLAAAQQTTPGAAACTSLGAATFTAVATLTATYDVGSAAQPAHCVGRGSAAPRTGVDGKAYETRFELRLPTDWGGWFLYQGGGGNDGIVRNSRYVSVGPKRPSALSSTTS